MINGIIWLGVVVGTIIVLGTFFTVLIKIFSDDEAIRYLTPKSIRKRHTALKMAEIDNKISFEQLKNDKLAELRMGAVSEVDAITAVEKGRELLSGEKRSRY